MNDTDVAARLAEALYGDEADEYRDSPRVRALLPVVREIADQRAAEAVRPFEELFSGGPDTPCRTTWRDPLGGRAAEVRTTECVEVPMDDLRDAFDRAAALRGEHECDQKTSQPTGLGNKEGDQDGKQGGVHPDRTRQAAEGPDGRGVHGGPGLLDHSGLDPQGRLANGAGRGLTRATPGGTLISSGVATLRGEAGR